MIDFKREKKGLYAEIKKRFDPLFLGRGFRWKAPNSWVLDLGWADQRCSLGVREVRSRLYLDLIGGAGMFVRRWHPVFQPDFEEYSSIGIPPASIGGPIHWIDKRLDFDSGRFTSLPEFEALLSSFYRAFEEKALPELAALTSEDQLFAVLFSENWSERISLAASQDRRAALAALMLSDRSGRESALEWAVAERNRIRAQEPGEERPGRWSELQNAMEYLSGA